LEVATRLSTGSAASTPNAPTVVLNAIGGTGRIAGRKVLVDLPPDCFELAVLELNDANAVPGCGGMDQHRVFSGGEE